jgi:hypothetical protein
MKGISWVINFVGSGRKGSCSVLGYYPRNCMEWLIEILNKDSQSLAENRTCGLAMRSWNASHSVALIMEATTEKAAVLIQQGYSVSIFLEVKAQWNISTITYSRDSVRSDVITDPPTSLIEIWASSGCYYGLLSVIFSLNDWIKSALNFCKVVNLS